MWGDGIARSSCLEWNRKRAISSILRWNHWTNTPCKYTVGTDAIQEALTRITFLTTSSFQSSCAGISALLSSSFQWMKACSTPTIVTRPRESGIQSANVAYRCRRIAYLRSQLIQNWPNSSIGKLIPSRGLRSPMSIELRLATGSLRSGTVY